MVGAGRSRWVWLLILEVLAIAALAFLSLALARPAAAQPAHCRFSGMVEVLEDRRPPRPRGACGQFDYPPGRPAHCWNGCDDQGRQHLSAVGSQNHPLISAAARGDWRFIAAQSRFERQNGLLGLELGSNAGYYSVGVAVAKMVGLELARRAGTEANAAADAEAIRVNLRALWGYWALQAVPRPRAQVAALWWPARPGLGRPRRPPAWQHVKPWDGEDRQGLSVALAGMRFKFEERYRRKIPHGHVLAWAVDWRPRIPTSDADLRPRWWRRTWSDQVIVTLGGAQRYTNHVRPEVWGLRPEERAVLKTMIRECSGGDRAVCLRTTRQVAGWLGEVPVYRQYRHGQVVEGGGFRVRIRRTTAGVEVIFFHARNGLQTGAMYGSVDLAGVQRVATACRARYLGANRGWRVAFDASTREVVMGCDDGGVVKIKGLPGVVVYDLELGQHGVLWRNSDVGVHERQAAAVPPRAAGRRVSGRR